MKNETKQWNISSLMTLLVFFLFAIMLLMVILSGARIYRRTTESARARFETRTIAQYLTTRIRQADSTGQIEVCTFGNGDALVFREQLNGEAYHTLIYSYDGWLRELFCAENSPLSPGAGEKILPLQTLILLPMSGGIQVHAVPQENTTLSFFLQLHAGMEVLP